MTAYVDRDALHAFLERAAPETGVGAATVRIHADLCEVRIHNPAASTVQVVGLIAADAAEADMTLTIELFRFRAAVTDSRGSVSINIEEGLVGGRKLAPVSSTPLIDRPSGTPFTAEIHSPLTLTSAGVVAVAQSVVDAFTQYQATTVALIADGNRLYLSGAADPRLVVVATGRII